MITTALVAQRSVAVSDNRPSQAYPQPNDQTTWPIIAPGLKSFTLKEAYYSMINSCYQSRSMCIICNRFSCICWLHFCSNMAEHSLPLCRMVRNISFRSSLYSPTRKLFGCYKSKQTTIKEKNSEISNLGILYDA